VSIAKLCAGIYNSAGTPAPPTEMVCVDSLGLLFGAIGACPGSSSRRLKDNIADMGSSSNKLFQLRPVTFFYKSQYDDGSHALQYGLIAEEVATVYPEMAVYDKDGQPSGVKYQLLAPMLLNEVQKQYRRAETQAQIIQEQEEKIDDLEQRLARLESYVATQMKAAADNPPQTTPGANGGLQ
jgi:Chaperone of endosialidase